MTNETKVSTLPARLRLAVEDTWRLEDIFASDEAWENDYKEVKEDLTKQVNFKVNLGESADTLYSALQFQDSVFENWESLYICTYALRPRYYEFFLSRI